MQPQLGSRHAARWGARCVAHHVGFRLHELATPPACHTVCGMLEQRTASPLGACPLCRCHRVLVGHSTGITPFPASMRLPLPAGQISWQPLVTACAVRLLHLVPLRTRSHLAAGLSRPLPSSPQSLTADSFVFSSPLCHPSPRPSCGCRTPAACAARVCMPAARLDSPSLVPPAVFSPEFARSWRDDARKWQWQAKSAQPS